MTNSFIENFDRMKRTVKVAVSRRKGGSQTACWTASLALVQDIQKI